MNLTKKLIFGLLLTGALFTTACGSDGPKVGDTCAKEADCGDELTCDMTAKKCAEKPAAGANKLANDKACDAHDKCTSGFCDLDGTNKCKDAPGKGTVADGGTCSNKEQCKTTDATCDANKCKAPAPAKLANGKTCTKAKDCQSDFCDVNTEKCATPTMPKNCTKTSECTAKEVCGVFGSMKICTPKCDTNPDICTTSYPCGEVTTVEGGAKVQACSTP